MYYLQEARAKKAKDTKMLSDLSGKAKSLSASRVNSQKNSGGVIGVSSGKSEAVGHHSNGDETSKAQAGGQEAEDITADVNHEGEILDAHTAEKRAGNVISSEDEVDSGMESFHKDDAAKKVVGKCMEAGSLFSSNFCKPSLLYIHVIHFCFSTLILA